MPKLEIIIQKCVHITFNYRQFILSGFKNYAWGSSYNRYNKYNYYHFFGTQKVISNIYIYIYICHTFSPRHSSQHFWDWKSSFILIQNVSVLCHLGKGEKESSFMVIYNQKIWLVLFHMRKRTPGRRGQL